MQNKHNKEIDQTCTVFIFVTYQSANRRMNSYQICTYCYILYYLGSTVTKPSFAVISGLHCNNAPVGKKKV